MIHFRYACPFHRAGLYRFRDALITTHLLVSRRAIDEYNASFGSVTALLLHGRITGHYGVSAATIECPVADTSHAAHSHP